jgi:hypothetical protein
MTEVLRIDMTSTSVIPLESLERNGELSAAVETSSCVELCTWDKHRCLEMASRWSGHGLYSAPARHDVNRPTC